MHQRSDSELRGVSPQRGVPTRRTIPDRAWWRSVLRRGAGRRSPRPPAGAPLWAWLLLGALVVPGARSFLSEEQEELLVELHNHYRGQVSPSASAMLPLKWDSGLKLIAEGYATKCIWNHNPELEDTGENLFAGTGSLDLREAMEKWFLEYLDYDYQNNSCDEDKMCGHYTQMVWADTHRVGCAFHLCNTMEGLDWERVSFLVCNYYPAGNYEDERPYVEGDWCSRCPENLQKCENNLCGPDVEEEDDGEEEATAVPSIVASVPSTQPEEEEEEEEEKVVPPPATTDSYPQPADVTPAGPSQDPEDPPETFDPNTPPPRVLPTLPGPEEEEEEEEEEEVKVEEEEWRMESADKVDEERGRDVTGPKSRKKPSASSEASVCSPSLLLAGLSGILTLRL